MNIPPLKGATEPSTCLTWTQGAIALTVVALLVSGALAATCLHHHLHGSSIGKLQGMAEVLAKEGSIVLLAVSLVGAGGIVAVVLVLRLRRASRAEETKEPALPEQPPPPSSSSPVEQQPPSSTEPDLRQRLRAKTRVGGEDIVDALGDGELFEELVKRAERGTLLGSRMGRGYSILHCIARSSLPPKVQIERMKILLAHPVDVNVQDTDGGRTALFYVTDKEVFRFLVEHGANPEYVPRHGGSLPMQLFYAKGKLHLLPVWVELTQTKEAIDKLLPYVDFQKNLFGRLTLLIRHLFPHPTVFDDAYLAQIIHKYSAVLGKDYQPLLDELTQAGRGENILRLMSQRDKSEIVKPY